MENKFEDKMKRLEEIVNLLETNNADLDESLKLFEEGLALSKDLTKDLENFEEKINLLTKDDENE